MARILVPLAQGCEELEAVTIIDLLRRANLEVITASLDEAPVIASRKTTLLADTTINEIQDQSFDLVALPGGLPGADYLAADARIAEILCRTVKAGGRVAAICAAPKVLALAGLLQSRKATAYPGVLEEYANSGVTLTNATVEIDGPIITSKGPGTAMEFSLTLIELLCGTHVRQTVEQALQRP